MAWSTSHIRWAGYATSVQWRATASDYRGPWVTPSPSTSIPATPQSRSPNPPGRYSRRSFRCGLAVRYLARYLGSLSHYESSVFANEVGVRYLQIDSRDFVPR